MTDTPNAVLRGGPADGEAVHTPHLGDPVPYEDDGGGSITYLPTDQVEERDGIVLRVYEVKA